MINIQTTIKECKIRIIQREKNFALNPIKIFDPNRSRDLRKEMTKKIVYVK